MNKLYKAVLLIALSVSASYSHATVWTITTPGFNFSPPTITIPLGDTVMFAIGSNHNAVEVSQATWNANGNVSNFGFSLPLGGGMFIPTTVKTYFYVCQPHASMGMKGQIIVNPNTGIPTVDAEDKVLRFQPNPVAVKTIVHTGVADGTANQFKIFDLTGKQVMIIENISNNFTLDIGFLKNGIYFAEFRSEGYRRTSKLVISRGL